MPPRIRIQPRQIPPKSTPQRTPYICLQCRNASLATATTPAPPTDPTTTGAPPIARYPPKQPPSHKPPEFRKSQLHRQYQSLLRSSPLIVIFQHNNLKATEWMGIRRELAKALQKVDEEFAKDGRDEGSVGSGTKIQVVQTGIFASALRVVEFWDPNFEPSHPPVHPSDSKTATSTPISDTSASNTSDNAAFTHGLSTRAWATSIQKTKTQKHGLEPLFSGPLAILTFPSVSPTHLSAALSILSPGKDFPAPRRRANPAYHEPVVQTGLQKLMLLAARVEGRVFDVEGARWVGGIEGGIGGLRAKLVAMLQGVGAGVTSTLEAAGRSLWVTVEGRRGMLEEEEEKGGKESKEE